MTSSLTMLFVWCGKIPRMKTGRSPAGLLAGEAGSRAIPKALRGDVAGMEKAVASHVVLCYGTLSVHLLGVLPVLMALQNAECSQMNIFVS